MISQYDYANDAVGRRTSVKHSGTVFADAGDAFNLYGYNDRGELTEARRYFGTNLSQTNNPVGCQAYAYDYDNIGNRESGGRARPPDAPPGSDEVTRRCATVSRRVRRPRPT